MHGVIVTNLGRRCVVARGRWSCVDDLIFEKALQSSEDSYREFSVEDPQMISSDYAAAQRATKQFGGTIISEPDPPISEPGVVY